MRLFRLMAILALLPTLPSCAALPSLLPKIVQGIGAAAEAAQLLTLLENEAEAVYPGAVPPEFSQALQATRATLHALQAAQLASESGDGPAYQRALQAFRAAFVQLRMAASRLGIIRPDGTLAHTRASGTSFGGAPAYVFPTPRLLQE